MPDVAFVVLPIVPSRGTIESGELDHLERRCCKYVDSISHKFLVLCKCPDARGIYGNSIIAIHRSSRAFKTEGL